MTARKCKADWSGSSCGNEAEYGLFCNKCRNIGANRPRDIACPFCARNRFDYVTLKNHLLNGQCAEFESTGRV